MGMILHMYLYVIGVPTVHKLFIVIILLDISQLAGAAGFISCIFAEGYTPNIECPGFYIKQSDGEALVKLNLGECGVHLYCHCSQLYSVPISGSNRTV